MTFVFWHVILTKVYQILKWRKNNKEKIIVSCIRLFLMTTPVCVHAATYRANGYIGKNFGKGKVIASVSYAKNTSIGKDTVICMVTVDSKTAVDAKGCYNETAYIHKSLVNGDRMSESEGKKEVSSVYCYGKLVLSGDVHHTLYADE